MKSRSMLALGIVAVLAIAATAAQAPEVSPLAFADVKMLEPLLCMAVVSKFGSGARDPAVLKATDAIFAAGTVKCLNSQIAITNGDSINSTFEFGEVPADAIPDPTSAYFYSAVTGVTDFDIGFRYPQGNGGAVIDLDALVDGDDIATAGNQTLFGHGTLTTANMQKRFWELAGLTANPGGNLSVYATLKAAATANGTVDLKLRYFKPD